MTFPSLGLAPAALLPSARKRLPIALVDPHEVLSPLFAAPGKRSLDHRARHPGALQQIQGRPHDRALHRSIPGLSTGVSEGEVRKHKTGDTAFLDNVARRAHDYGGNPIFFEMSGDQTHGLVANRSERRQKNGVDPILPAPCEKLRCEETKRLPLAVMGRYTIETA